MFKIKTSTTTKFDRHDKTSRDVRETTPIPVEAAKPIWMPKKGEHFLLHSNNIIYSLCSKMHWIVRPAGVRFFRWQSKRCEPNRKLYRVPRVSIHIVTKSASCETGDLPWPWIGKVFKGSRLYIMGAKSGTENVHSSRVMGLASAYARL